MGPMAQRDLIVSFLSSVPNAVMSAFRDKPLTLTSPVGQRARGKWAGGRAGYRQWLNQYRDADGSLIPRMWQAAGGKSGDTIGRICVMGFSNGCIGVDEVLRGSDSAKIDVVLAIDGIHGGYVVDRDTGDKVLHPPHYKRYINHAIGVLQENPDVYPHAPVMAITHSVIRPPGFPSTTETADLIWRLAYAKAPEDVLDPSCDWDCAPKVHLGDIAADKTERTITSSNTHKKYTWRGRADGWYDRRAANNFFVFGWGDRDNGKMATRDPTGNADHIYQGRVILPTMLGEFAVKRWNNSCGVAAAGLGDIAMCKLGEGRPYDGNPAEKQDYYPEGLPTAAPAVTCPAPPPGRVIVGSGADPCATAPGEAEAPSPGPIRPRPRRKPTAPFDWADAILFAGAAGAGYWAADYWLSSR